MVYVEANQTEKYPQLKQHYKTTTEHFHDQPLRKEPHKTSTSAKLYENSLYFMSKRLEKPVTEPKKINVQLGEEPPKTKDGKVATQPYTWSGQLNDTYEGNGTFRLNNQLSYSVKPVKLVPHSALTFKTEYQSQYIKKQSTKGKDGFSTIRTSTKNCC